MIMAVVGQTEKNSLRANVFRSSPDRHARRDARRWSSFQIHHYATLALPAIAFAAVGTARQRCTSLRIIHRTVYDAFFARLKQIYASVRIGNPASKEPAELGLAAKGK
jgi:Aldehyde dehydrogenase family